MAAAAAVAAEAAAAEARGAGSWWKRPGCRHTARQPPRARHCQKPPAVSAATVASAPVGAVAVISAVAIPAVGGKSCLFCPCCWLEFLLSRGRHS